VFQMNPEKENSTKVAAMPVRISSKRGCRGTRYMANRVAPNIRAGRKGIVPYARVSLNPKDMQYAVVVASPKAARITRSAKIKNV